MKAAVVDSNEVGSLSGRLATTEVTEDVLLELLVFVSCVLDRKTQRWYHGDTTASMEIRFHGDTNPQARTCSWSFNVCTNVFSSSHSILIVGTNIEDSRNS